MTLWHTRDRIALAGKRTSSEATMSANDRQGMAFGLNGTRWLAKEKGIQSLPESFGLSAQEGVM
jgi:hypothetical protein